MYSPCKYLIIFILPFNEDVEISVWDSLNNGLMFIITVNVIVILPLPSHAEALENQSQWSLQEGSSSLGLGEHVRFKDPFSPARNNYNQDH